MIEIKTQKKIKDYKFIYERYNKKYNKKNKKKIKDYYYYHYKRNKYKDRICSPIDLPIDGVLRFD
jgi:wobble nucleotide-excising tRNase